MNKYTERLIHKLNTQHPYKLKLRDCGICKAPLYFHSYNGEIYFDPHCDCMSYRVEPPRLQTPEDLDFYTEQEGWRKHFGLEDKEEELKCQPL